MPDQLAGKAAVPKQDISRADNNPLSAVKAALFDVLRTEHRCHSALSEQIGGRRNITSFMLRYLPCASRKLAGLCASGATAWQSHARRSARERSEQLTAGLDDWIGQGE
jgi:hypothetical protein